MSYLGLDLDSLVWELKSLIENNYGCFELKNLEEHFEKARKDILETFKDISNQNKQVVFNELKDERK